MKRFSMGILVLIFTLPVLALEQMDIDRLLRQKNTSLSALEARGGKLLVGEVTGHGRGVPFSQVEAIITHREAILKQEIDAVSFQGRETLDNIQAIRFNGTYILKEDVKATIIRR
jgi:hypothetical protein